MAGNVETMTIASPSPIEEKRSPPNECHCSSKRYVFVEIEDSRWIDEGGNEDSDWSIAAMISQAASSDARDLRRRRRRRSPLRIFIGAKSNERVARKRRIALGDVAYQFEKERQRTRCVFMLRRTMLR